MALTINTNLSSLYAQQYLAKNQSQLSNTLLRLSSGKRINMSSDDPAGLAIANTMQSNIDGLNVGSRNAQDGVNLVQTASGAMQEILADLQLMKQLAVQAANGTNGSGDLANLDAEYQALLGAVDRIASATNFNNVAILNGGSITIQIGANATSNDQITINLVATSASSLGISGSALTSSSIAFNVIGSLGTAIETLTTGLATLGANAVNLNSAIANNNTYATSLSAAKSAILDADYAAESANMAKYSILMQSDIAMLAQANSSPQLVLKLLG